MRVILNAQNEASVSIPNQRSEMPTETKEKVMRWLGLQVGFFGGIEGFLSSSLGLQELFASLID
ncbi:hypothetical protein BGAL_0730g00040 [Botrytis galanthina]|uniref:Uncharacterized protein n=1 Tax=Botrytis galanthina TaxID=278940 RepID=A0A4S8QTV2_9HELO|nr:hypothetical protein BGAL_0730g00040 [Botrytis galanthina]